MFVAKGSGRLRAVFDTRVANCFFGNPPRTSLPSPQRLSSLKSRVREQLYFAGGDIDTAFYRMSAPKCAKKCFTLPPIKAKYLKVTSVNGAGVGPEDPLRQCWKFYRWGGPRLCGFAR